MEEDFAIVTQGLTKQYKNITAVNNLDLAVPRGTIYGFLGPNGAGKTTTIRMLLGLITPSKGNLSVLGYDVETQRDKVAQKIGAIVEVPAFYNYLTGEQNLKVFAYTSNISLSSKEIDKLINKVGLTKRGKDKVKTYSLGMKQRLGLAATLISDPQILFLDEPTNGLDPAGTVEIRKLISELGAENRTIFLSSHLLNEVEQVCTDVVIVKEGEKKLEGKMSQLLAQSKGFSIKVNSIKEAMSILKQYSELEPRVDKENWIFIKIHSNDIPSIIKKLVSEKIKVYQIVECRSSLEELFLELTGQPKENMSN